MRAMPVFTFAGLYASLENWIALHPGSFLAILALTTACAFVATLHYGDDARHEMDDAPKGGR